MFRIIYLIAALAFISPGSKAENVTPPREIAVGQRAPSFHLRDQNDREISLDSLVKRGPVALVFVRSVEWCVYCQLQTMQLNENRKEIEAEGGQVVVVTYDRPEKIKRFASSRKIALPILSDADSRTIDAYAMRSVQGAGDQVGSSQHGTFIIDVDGIVRSKPYLKSFEGRGAVDALIEGLRDAKTPKGQP